MLECIINWVFAVLNWVFVKFTLGNTLSLLYLLCHIAHINWVFNNSFCLLIPFDWKTIWYFRKNNWVNTSKSSFCFSVSIHKKYEYWLSSTIYMMNAVSSRVYRAILSDLATLTEHWTRQKSNICCKSIQNLAFPFP